MEHHNLRKYRGPETWALVREEYLKGVPGPLLAKRYDVGLANLRKKARKEGWTRRKHALATDAAGVRRMAARAAEAGEAPPTPAAAVEAAVRLASEALLSGRSAEAAATLRAAEQMARLVERTAPPPPAEAELEPEAESPEAWLEAQEQAWAQYKADVLKEAERIAHHMLQEIPAGCPAGWSREVYRFRARHFGPEVAAADYAYGVSKGWGHRVWDEHGKLRPPEPPVTPATWALEQHERCCAWMREHGQGE